MWTVDLCSFALFFFFFQLGLRLIRIIKDPRRVQSLVIATTCVDSRSLFFRAFFFSTWFAIHSNHKSTTTVRELRHRRCHCMEASLDQLSHETSLRGDGLVSFVAANTQGSGQETETSRACFGIFGLIIQNSAFFVAHHTSPSQETVQRWTCSPSTIPPNC